MIVNDEELEKFCDIIESLEITLAKVSLALKVIREDLSEMFDCKED